MPERSRGWARAGLRRSITAAHRPGSAGPTGRPGARPASASHTLTRASTTVTGAPSASGYVLGTTGHGRHAPPIDVRAVPAPRPGRGLVPGTYRLTRRRGHVRQDRDTGGAVSRGGRSGEPPEAGDHPDPPAGHFRLGGVVNPAHPSPLIRHAVPGTMKLPLYLTGRWPVSPATRAGIGAAVALLAFVAAVELVDGPEPNYVGLIAAAPFLAAVFASWRVVLGVGAFATVAALGFALMAPVVTRQTAVNVAGVALATGIAAAVAALRQRQAARIAELARLASVAQQAVLRPIGPTVGSLSVAGRYSSATAAADIGGDLYEALDTPYGVRVIIGDVRGKGLDAVRTASIVLGAYRHVAFERADLREIVADLDRAVARSVGEEDFVTAVLMEERGGTLTIVNCGHPSPLLLRRGYVISLDPPGTAPPLGFMPAVKPRVERLEPADRLLLFTDGLGEARRDGAVFPITQRAWGLLGHGKVADGLASLESALVEWVRGRLDDDIALVLMEYAGAAPTEQRAQPSWEFDIPPPADRVSG